MKTDKFGRIFLNEQEAFDLLYTGKIANIEEILFENEIPKYTRARELNADKIPNLNFAKNLDNLNVDEFDKIQRSQWFMPEEYRNFDIENWLYQQCNHQVSIDRVSYELDLYKKYKVFDVLIYLKYLVDVMKNNKIVWGVGRGSSVSSYILFLLGVHKIDSIKYNLDIHEFLKEK